MVQTEARIFGGRVGGAGGGGGLTEDGTEPVVREVFMMLVMTRVRREDEMGSRWQLENFMDEKSLAGTDGVKGEEGEKLRYVSGKMSGSEWIGVEAVDVSELSMVFWNKEMRDLSVENLEVMSMSMVSFANVEKRVQVLKELRRMSRK